MNIEDINKEYFDVIYMAPVEFPEGGAPAKRIINMAQKFRRLGYSVAIISGSRHGESTTFLVDGITVFRIYERTLEGRSRFIKYLGYSQLGKKSTLFLQQLSYPPKFIIIYSGYTPYILHIMTWRKGTKTKIIFDVVEWYTPGRWFGYINPYYLNIEFAMRYLLPQLDGLICISRYLEAYYSEKNVPIVRIPPTYSAISVRSRTTHFSKKRVSIVYAGAPERKDALWKIVAAISAFASSEVILELVVVGMDVVEAQKNFAWKNSFIQGENVIKFVGRVTRNEAESYVRRANFTILLRDNTKSSRAGFSTKVVESLSLGTPVICNLTGDLGDILIDNHNSLIIETNSCAALRETLARLEHLKPTTYAQMRYAAFDTAERYFRYDRYLDKMKYFLSEIN